MTLSPASPADISDWCSASQSNKNVSKNIANIFPPCCLLDPPGSQPIIYSEKDGMSGIILYRDIGREQAGGMMLVLSSVVSRDVRICIRTVTHLSTRDMPWSLLIYKLLHINTYSLLLVYLFAIYSTQLYWIVVLSLFSCLSLQCSSWIILFLVQENLVYIGNSCILQYYCSSLLCQPEFQKKILMTSLILIYNIEWI